MIIFDIFFFVLLVALSVNVLSYTFFCYEEANQRGHSLAPLAGMAVRSIARSVWSEMLILASLIQAVGALLPIRASVGAIKMPTDGAWLLQLLIVLLRLLPHLLLRLPPPTTTTASTPTCKLPSHQLTYRPASHY